MTDKFYIPPLSADPYDGPIPSPERFRRIPALNVVSGDWVRFDGIPYRVISAKVLQKTYVVLTTAHVNGGAFVFHTVLKHKVVETYKS